MENNISQEEINSASGANRGSKTPNEQGILDRDVVPFDFQLPHRLSKRQLQAFIAVHETFAEVFSSYLLSRLQSQVTVDSVSVDQIFYSQYVASTAKPSCLYVFRIGDSDALGVMELSPTLVLAIIARMLGGTTANDVEARSITRIEQNIIKGIVLRALSDLEKAWKTMSEQAFTLKRYETEGDFVQIAPASEIVIVVSFDLLLSDQKYSMNVCFPTFALEEVLSKLQNQTAGNAAPIAEHLEWQATIMKKLETTKTSVTGILGETTLSVQQLMELEPGDVLLTNTSTNSDLTILLGGKVRAFGKPGISNGKAAIKITQFVTDTNNFED